MSEFIVSVPDNVAEYFMAKFGMERATMFGYRLTGEIVRCRDCKHMHTVRSWYSDNLVDECWLHADPESGALGKEPTEPDGFCAWACRKSE